MIDFIDIFTNQSEKYDLLVSKEDYQNELIEAINSIVSLEGKNVIELGAGTGRVTRLLSNKVNKIDAFEVNESMVKVANKNIKKRKLNNCTISVADSRNVPVDKNVADISIAGWSLCCLVAFNKNSWRNEIEKALNEIERVVKQDGIIIIIETLGTGNEAPMIPNGLKEYYEILNKRNYKMKSIRTDFKFSNMNEAIDLISFFFGENMVESIKKLDNSIILPECTGIWYKKKEELL